MLRLLIVISSLFIGSFGVDVGFSFGSTCFSEDTSLELTAEYNGTGTVTAVQWYYSGQVSNNMFVLTSNCDTPGAVPAGFPDKSRMTFGCDLATNIFTLTLSRLLAEELDKSWGATFSLSVGQSPDVEQKQIIVCTKCTCDCNCKKKCKRIVIPSIIFGSFGAIILPVVIGGTVTEHFGQKTALVVDFIGFVCDVISLGLGIGVQVEDCCEGAEDCCEDSDCCEDECEKNWIETTAIVFIIIGCLVGIVAVVIFYLVWSGRIGRGNNGWLIQIPCFVGLYTGITKQDLRPWEEIVREKLLRVLESAYPKILSVKDLIRIDFAEERVVMEQLEELRRKDLIRKLDSGGFVRHLLDVKTRITKQDFRLWEEIVREMLLHVHESVYPNILSVTDLIRIDFAEERVVMEQLEELRRKDLIRQLDCGGFVRYRLDVKTAYKAEEAKEPDENDRLMETSY